MDALEKERSKSEIMDLHNMNFSLMTLKSNKKMFHVFSISDLFVYFLKFFFEDFTMILDFWAISPFITQSDIFKDSAEHFFISWPEQFLTVKVVVTYDGHGYGK